MSDARQRWVFRTVHSARPLQEKMALFWHNHFATGYTKIAGQLSAEAAARALAAKPSEDPSGVRGQLELFRAYALGNFRDLLVAVSQDPAMVAWLDGDTNVKNKPQENYARELMELFTMGVDFYTEADVHAGARVFTGWNLRRNRTGEQRSVQFGFVARALKEIGWAGSRPRWRWPRSPIWARRCSSRRTWPAGSWDRRGSPPARCSRG